MGKIYRLSNGGLVTVMVDDEANFFNILKEKNLTAELVNDPNTEYDNVPSYKASLSSDNTQEDPTVEVDTGIGIVYRKNHKRDHFNNEAGAMIIRFEKTESGQILFANNFTKNHLQTPIKRELKENEYKGMVIQIIRPVLVKGVNTTYKDLPIGQA